MWDRLLWYRTEGDSSDRVIIGYDHVKPQKWTGLANTIGAVFILIHVWVLNPRQTQHCVDLLEPRHELAGQI